MKETGLMFKAPLVRSILSGEKTQTRRIVKPRKDRDAGCELAACEIAGEVNEGNYRNSPWVPGDRIYVRETTLKVEDHGYDGPVYLESDEGRTCMEWGLAPSEDDCTEVEPYEIKLRPSIQMPKSMARIWLEITGVRVERLQDISEADAELEGVDFLRAVPDADESLTAKQLFECLWESTGGDWNANPWVWVIDFKRIAQEGGKNG